MAVSAAGRVPLGLLMELGTTSNTFQARWHFRVTRFERLTWTTLPGNIRLIADDGALEQMPTYRTILTASSPLVVASSLVRQPYNMEILMSRRFLLLLSVPKDAKWPAGWLE